MKFLFKFCLFLSLVSFSARAANDLSAGKIYAYDTLYMRNSVKSTAIDHYATIKHPVAVAGNSAPITIDAATGDFFTTVLSVNDSLAAPTHPGAGRTFTLRARQDGTGSRTLHYNAVFRFPSGTAPVLTTTAAKTDYLSFIWNEVDSKWDYVGNAFNL